LRSSGQCLTLRCGGPRSAVAEINRYVCKIAK
jgi:uncharacterized protein YodC (DUF2158 family)